MSLIQEIPERFWGLFRSCNREIYIEALLRINEEYEYSNYYLSKEACIQTLHEYFEEHKVGLFQDEYEEDADLLEPAATRILNWLVRTGWLRKAEDYNSLTTNIIIPDYAAVMIEAMEKLLTDEEDVTQVYIQNVYALLFSLKNDARASVTLLDTALINTRRLNKALQDMLHNMDKFFGSLLERKNYGELLQDHLEHYVQEVVKKKYHILKTSDNFYIYKADIKAWLASMRNDEEWLRALCSKNAGSQKKISVASVLEKLDLIERGFDDIEQRIANMDKEHMKYVRATVSRLHYLLNEEDDMRGLVIQILNRLSEGRNQEQMIAQIGGRMNLSQVTILSNQSLYKRKKRRVEFHEGLFEEEEQEELTREELLELNQIKKRYSKAEVEAFILDRMEGGIMEVSKDTVRSQADFEKLILAYDYSVQKKSRFEVLEKKPENAEIMDKEPEMIEICGYRYPKLTFIRRTT